MGVHFLLSGTCVRVSEHLHSSQTQEIMHSINGHSEIFRLVFVRTLPFPSESKIYFPFHDPQQHFVTETFWKCSDFRGYVTKGKMACPWLSLFLGPLALEIQSPGCKEPKPHEAL